MLTIATKSRAWIITTSRFVAVTLSTGRTVQYHHPTRRLPLKEATNNYDRTFTDNNYNTTYFQPGDKIQIEIVYFGPLGASVDIVSKSHDPEDVIRAAESPLAKGLVLQREIQLFRQKRNNVDVVRGEVLPAYVERVRDDGKIDICFRTFGGRLLPLKETTNNDDTVTDNNDNTTSFQPGDKIQIEVVSFGPMGASVEVISKSHDPNDIIPESELPLAKGLVLQREIQYFREKRNNVDVVRGEVLPAYVERVREDGKIDICLRSFGGRAKALELADLVLELLEQSPNGTLRVGDKSPPEDIAALFPGVSKMSFKKAVAALYKQGKVKPGPTSIALMKE